MTETRRLRCPLPKQIKEILKQAGLPVFMEYPDRRTPLPQAFAVLTYDTVLNSETAVRPLSGIILRIKLTVRVRFHHVCAPYARELSDKGMQVLVNGLHDLEALPVQWSVKKLEHSKELDCFVSEHTLQFEGLCHMKETDERDERNEQDERDGNNERDV